MTLKLEWGSNGDRPTLRLIGNVRSEDLEEIADELGTCDRGAALDLEEVPVCSTAEDDMVRCRDGASMPD